MDIQEAKQSDLDSWVSLRQALWPNHDPETLLREARSILRAPDEVCFLLVHPSRGRVGFVEAAVHPAPGGPYCHIEGWYVMPEFRGHGCGKNLIERIESWALHRTISIMTSDTESGYPLSPEAHARAGFRKLHELTIFVKELQ